MGLKLTLAKENNAMYTEFTDAYWVIDNISYTTTAVGFELMCFPSREAKYNYRVPMGPSMLPVGGPVREMYDPLLYRWSAAFSIQQIFEDGIPIDPNEQKTIIYNFIKMYTRLPFVDVLEEV